jgi:hypothetical protein
MLRFGTTIAAYKKVPAFFCSNDAEILALGFCTFTNAATNSQISIYEVNATTVTFFNFDGKTYTVMQTKPAPGTAHTAFYRTQLLP